MHGRRCFGSLLIGAVVIASCSSDSEDGLFGSPPGSGADAGEAGSDNGGQVGTGGRPPGGSGGSVGTAGESGMGLTPGTAGESGAPSGSAGEGASGGDAGTVSGGAGGAGAVSSGGTSNGGSAVGGTTGGKPATGGAPSGGTGGTQTGGTTSTGGAEPTGGSGGLCGGIECGEAQVCCGPSECGYCINPNTDPACATECPARDCGEEGLRCLDQVLGFPGELCVEIEISVGPTSERSWVCHRDHCEGSPVDCECAGSICEEVSSGTTCAGLTNEGELLCIGGGPCNSPDTPVATPFGERAIGTLRPGELVYSIDGGAMSAVPIRWVARTPVERHRVVRLVLETGAVLEISPDHPLADGRRFEQIEPGRSIEGVEIVSRDLVDYGYSHTYDILPASDSGTYVAAGLVLGSTLAPRTLDAN